MIMNYARRRRIAEAKEIYIISYIISRKKY
jgi:hypothetical protein